MSTSAYHYSKHSDELAFLCVDAFVSDFMGSRALTSAFETGLIDDLLQHQPCIFSDLVSRRGMDIRGLNLLLDMLQANQVIVRDESLIKLSTPFIEAMHFRDLLEMKLYFANLVAPDFLNLFTVLLTNSASFFEKAKVFELFSYGRCFDPNPQNYQLTTRWMRITTAFTKYEAAVCMQHHDFSSYHRHLDIGGNSGEFALRLCKQNPGLHSTVVDLPLVCEIGAKHVSAEPEAQRINFVISSGTQDPTPRGFDLVTFKSMLHDWPDKEMQQFLKKAHNSLTPGGTLLIFERTQMTFENTQIPYATMPFMLFFRSYRATEVYQKQLEKLEFRNIQIQVVALEMPFILITAQK
jgi:SAM-dependent methyltransferase